MNHKTKNRSHGSLARYDSDQQPKKRKPNNRFSGSYEKYNSEDSGSDQLNETFTPEQKKILGEGLEDLKNTIVASLTTLNAKRSEDQEKENQRKDFRFMRGSLYM